MRERSQSYAYGTGIRYVDDRIGIILAETGGYYETGFHAYKLKKAAQRTAICQEPVRRVRLSNLTAMGKQDGRVVFVGKEMLILPKGKRK